MNDLSQLWTSSRPVPAVLIRFWFVILLIAPFRALAAEPEPADLDNQVFDPRLQAFFVAKEKHAKELTRRLDLNVAPEVWRFLQAGIDTDWGLVQELYMDLRDRSGQYTGTRMDETVRTPVWQTVNEGFGAYQAFSQLRLKFIEAFSQEIIRSIPKGSIYFGGTDPGRWLITAFCRSHADGDPFFVLTQNALADSGYLQYLEAAFGGKIAIPKKADEKRAFDEYLADAGARFEGGKLKPGENVKKVDGKYQVSGAVAVFAINAILARTLFDHNPSRDFYLEESRPLEWMYPHLSPHGLIFKLNRAPLETLPEPMVRKDQEFWENQTARWVGQWVKPGTTVKEIAAFAQRIYGEVDLSDFKGDHDFITADRRYPPQKIYGKLRSAQAVLYAWRARQAKAAAEKARMTKAAELAFKQAAALCPFSSDQALPYASWLKEQNRVDDARMIANTALDLGSNNRELRRLMQELDAPPN